MEPDKSVNCLFPGCDFRTNYAGNLKPILEFMILIRMFGILFNVSGLRLYLLCRPCLSCEGTHAETTWPESGKAKLLLLPLMPVLTFYDNEYLRVHINKVHDIEEGYKRDKCEFETKVIPPALGFILEKCMEKEKNLRYSSASTLSTIVLTRRQLLPMKWENMRIK